MVFLPEVFLGALRVGTTPVTLAVLFSEPLPFAAHYTTVADILDWPEEIVDIHEHPKLARMLHILPAADLGDTRISTG